MTLAQADRGPIGDSIDQLRLYRLLVENSLGLMCIHDLEGVLHFINPAAAQALVERTAELQQANERLVAEIRQRKLVEEELLRGRKLESLGVLAGGIAHDFNNFLTIIYGNIALAKMQLKSADPVVEILDQAAVACKRATSLASQLLTFGKGGAPVRRPTQLAAVVRDAVDLARAGATASYRALHRMRSLVGRYRC